MQSKRNIKKWAEILLEITDLLGLKIYLFPTKLKVIITCLEVPIQAMFLLLFKIISAHKSTEPIW